MGILINGKDTDINISQMVSCIKEEDGSATIKLVNGDSVKLEPYSFVYFKNHRSMTFTSFSIDEYRELTRKRMPDGTTTIKDISECEAELGKNTYTSK